MENKTDKPEEPTKTGTDMDIKQSQPPAELRMSGAAHQANAENHVQPPNGSGHDVQQPPQPSNERKEVDITQALISEIIEVGTRILARAATTKAPPQPSLPVGRKPWTLAFEMTSMVDPGFSVINVHVHPHPYSKDDSAIATAALDANLCRHVEATARTTMLDDSKKIELGMYVKEICATMAQRARDETHPPDELKRGTRNPLSKDAKKHATQDIPRENEHHDGAPTDGAPKSDASKKDGEDDKKNDVDVSFMEVFETRHRGLKWMDAFLAVRGMVAIAEFLRPKIGRNLDIDRLNFWKALGETYQFAICWTYNTVNQIREGNPPLFEAEKSAPAASESASQKPAAASAPQQSDADKKKEVPRNRIVGAIGLPRNVIWTPEPTSGMSERDLKQLVDLALKRLDEISDFVYPNSVPTPSADGGDGKKEGEDPARALEDFLQKRSIYEWTYHKLAKPGFLYASFKMEFMPMQPAELFFGLMPQLRHPCRCNRLTELKGSPDEESEADEAVADEIGTGTLLIEEVDDETLVPSSGELSNATTDDKGAPNGTASSDAGTK